MKSGGYSIVRDINGRESRIPPTEQTKLFKQFGISETNFSTDIIEKRMVIQGASCNMGKWGLH